MNAILYFVLANDNFIIMKLVAFEIWLTTLKVGNTCIHFGAWTSNTVNLYSCRYDI